MPPRNPLSDAERAKILELHAARETRNNIAKLVSRSPGAVSKVVADAGLTFERGEQVQAATRAKQVDNQAKRAELETRFLDEAALLLDQLHQPHRVYNFGGKDNSYEERLHDEPDVQAKATLVKAAGTAVDKAVRLADVDKATSGADVGRSLVSGLFDALRAREGDG